ncbi:phosphatidylinositol-specific phospholipase C domain-containing protein [Burkholderia sp. L27(2015)]|uniref:phosphatidylinositol-specific phospholipase C domain-containing protein n=1 Tax=Burkholderia sp. L27(2015) TaxID=1641858 RepID=UPI00131AAF1D|nr:phosphatidylinositol-specific phospholipase C domain-containing protein [Burkholderia sp. L27(2015)]
MNMQNWMASLEPKQSIAWVSIPGTHESGAIPESVSQSQCQYHSIRDQLDLGIRFLDIRLKEDGLDKPLRVVHGPSDQELTFASVLVDVYNFLEQHKTEFVLMNVQKYDEHTRGAFSTKFDAEVRNNESKWFFEARIPTVGEARGRIVLIRANGKGQAWESTKGIPWNGHDVNGELGFGIKENGFFSTQNRWYLIATSNKKIWIEQNIKKIAYPPDIRKSKTEDEIKTSRDSEKILLNFLSSTWGESLRLHAVKINQTIFEFLKDQKEPPRRYCLGVMPMDFAGNVDGFISEIVKRNILNGARVRDQRGVNNGAVYLVLDGKLRGIPRTAYEALFKDWESIINYPDLDRFAIEKDLSEHACLAKVEGTKDAFLLLDGEKRLISSSDVFDWYGFDEHKVNEKTADELEAIPTGKPLD